MIVGGRNKFWYLLVLIFKESNLPDTSLTEAVLEFIVQWMRCISLDTIVRIRTFRS